MTFWLETIGLNQVYSRFYIAMLSWRLRSANESHSSFRLKTSLHLNFKMLSMSSDTPEKQLILSLLIGLRMRTCGEELMPFDIGTELLVNISKESRHEGEQLLFYFMEITDVMIV